jgi:hypothetical protein
MARDRMFTTFATRRPDGAQRNPGSFLLAPPKPLVSVLPLSQRAGRFRSPCPFDELRALDRSFHRRNAQPANPIRTFKNWPLRYWTQAFLGYLDEATAESNHKFADL